MIRRLRRVATRLGLSVVPGREPVLIDDLVSPLRYDILVRQQFFSFLDRHEELLQGDLGPLVELSRAHPYFTWFVEVLVPRFKPALLGDEAGIRQAFEARVSASVALRSSFEAAGQLLTSPLTLVTGRNIRPTATEKLLRRRIYPADGCHRIALLRARGVTVLEPHTYRLQITRSLTPIDNTALLLDALPIDGEAYWDFLALSYGELAERERSRAHAPRAAEAGDERLAELRRVAAIDARYLRSPSSASR